MGKTKTRITDYKNFWLIWLSCAGKPKEGESLFQIQSRWGIKTNYLYHNEAGLGKPLYVCMIRDGYIKKSGRRLVAQFGWISDYLKESYASRKGGVWFPEVFVGSRLPVLQSFIEDNANVLFNEASLRILFLNDKDVLGTYGRHIFSDIFLYMLFVNLSVFTKKYHADAVMRILSTFIAMFSDRDLMSYIRMIHSKLGTKVPVLIRDEAELNRIAYPYRW